MNVTWKCQNNDDSSRKVLQLHKRYSTKTIFVYDCILKIYNFRDSEVDGKENIPEEKPKNLDDNLEKVCESETCWKIKNKFLW